MSQRSLKVMGTGTGRHLLFISYSNFVSKIHLWRYSPLKRTVTLKRRLAVMH